MGGTLDGLSLIGALIGAQAADTVVTVVNSNKVDVDLNFIPALVLLQV